MYITIIIKILSIDTGLSLKVKEATKDDFKWLDQYGEMAKFLRNDFRLIKRTKRARSTVIMGAFFALYGLIFIASEEVYGSTGAFFGLFFSTGGFMFTFCGMVPSWDSKHYPLMMCQNITYLDYIKSKWYLGFTGTIVMTLVGLLIYSYFGLFYALGLYVQVYIILELILILLCGQEHLIKQLLILILLKTHLEILNLLIPKQCL